MIDIQKIAREAGIHIYPEYTAAFTRFAALIREAAVLAQGDMSPASTHGKNVSMKQGFEDMNEAKQEPVAWMWKDGTITSDPDRADGTWTPLYAAPVEQALLEALNEDLYRQGVGFIARIAELEAALAVALKNCCGVKLCEINSMSSRQEMLRLLDETINLLKEVRK